jgi:hypothetical protein
MAKRGPPQGGPLFFDGNLWRTPDIFYWWNAVFQLTAAGLVITITNANN